MIIKKMLISGNFIDYYFSFRVKWFILLMCDFFFVLLFSKSHLDQDFLSSVTGKFPYVTFEHSLVTENILSTHISTPPHLVADISTHHPASPPFCLFFLKLLRAIEQKKNQMHSQYYEDKLRLTIICQFIS